MTLRACRHKKRQYTDRTGTDLGEAAPPSACESRRASETLVRHPRPPEGLDCGPHTLPMAPRVSLCGLNSDRGSVGVVRAAYRILLLPTMRRAAGDWVTGILHCMARRVITWDSNMANLFPPPSTISSGGSCLSRAPRFSHFCRTRLAEGLGYRRAKRGGFFLFVMSGRVRCSILRKAERSLRQFLQSESHRRANLSSRRVSLRWSRPAEGGKHQGTCTI